jgi:hypothetical protein
MNDPNGPIANDSDSDESKVIKLVY